MPKRDRTIFEPTPPVWKVRAMIERLGGVGPTTEKLMAKGFFPPGADTVQGWSSRNSLPGAWSPALFALAMDAGLIEGPMDALVRDFQLTGGHMLRQPHSLAAQVSRQSRARNQAKRKGRR